jgi:hypothetical protein
MKVIEIGNREINEFEVAELSALKRKSVALKRACCGEEEEEWRWWWCCCCCFCHSIFCFADGVANSCFCRSH